MKSHATRTPHLHTLLTAELKFRHITQPEIWLTVDSPQGTLTYGEAMRSQKYFKTLKHDDQLRVLAWGLQLGHFSPITSLLLEKDSDSNELHFSRNKLEDNIKKIQILLQIEALTHAHIQAIAQTIKTEHSIVTFQQFSDIFGISSSIFHSKTAFGKL